MLVHFDYRCVLVDGLIVRTLHKLALISAAVWVVSVLGYL
jgi:hypothetical protein